MTPAAQEPPVDAGAAVAVVLPMRRERDLMQVLAIERLVFTRPWTRMMFARMFDRAIGTHAFVARSDGQVIGYCVGQIVVDELHIHTLAVHPRWRGRGLARGLLARVLREAAGRGAASASLEVRRSNSAAQRLYETAGFIRSGVRRAYYPDPVEDALLYCLGRLDRDTSAPDGGGGGTDGVS